MTTRGLQSKDNHMSSKRLKLQSYQWLPSHTNRLTKITRTKSGFEDYNIKSLFRLCVIRAKTIPYSGLWIWRHVKMKGHIGVGSHMEGIFTFTSFVACLSYRHGIIQHEVQVVLQIFRVVRSWVYRKISIIMRHLDARSDFTLLFHPQNQYIMCCSRLQPYGTTQQ